MDASTFPISLTYHLVFALIAGIFFLVQFIRLRRCCWQSASWHLC